MNHHFLPVAVILAVVTAVGLTAEIHRPGYLVEGQPMPYAIAVKSDFRTQVFLDSYLLPLQSNEELLLILGGGYLAEEFPLHPAPKRVMGLYGSLFGTGNLGKHGFWLTYQSVGWFGDEAAIKNRALLKYFQITQFGYKRNSRLALKGGLMFVSNFGDPVLFPLAGVSYSTDRWVVDALIPASVEIRYIRFSNIQFLISTRINDQLFRPAQGNNVFRVANIESSIKVDWRASKWVWLSTQFSQIGMNSIRWEELGDSTKIPPEYRLSLGIELRIE